MKTLWRFKFSSVASAYLFAGVLNTLAIGTSENINGIYASAQYVPSWPDRGHAIRVYVHFRQPSTNISEIPSSLMIVKMPNAAKVGQTPIDVGIYFLATNFFCGYVELRDSTNGIVPLLKPKANSPETYPDTYNLKLASKLLWNPYNSALCGPGCLSGTDPEQSRFCLTDYFKIGKPGDYQLTVWPKIYKRSETNRDLVERIDIPPVTIPIKWTGNSQ